MFFKHRSSSNVYEAYRWDFRASLLVGIYTGAIFPFIGRVARGDLHCSPFQLSLIAAAPFIGNLFSPVWANQMEGKTKMPFAVWSWGISRSLFLLMAFIYGSWPFVLLVSLSQIIVTVSTPAYASIMKDIYPGRLRGRLMGYIRMGLQGVALVTALLAGRILDRTSFRFLFPIGAVAGVLSAWAFNHLPMIRRADSGDRPSYSVLDTMTILRDDPGFRWFSISIFVYGFGNLLVQPLYTLFQVDRLHITNTQVANIANLQSIAAIAAYYGWGRFLDSKGSMQTTFLNILVVGLVNVSYLFAFRVEHLYFAAVAAGISNAGIELAYINSILLFADRNRIAQYQSVHSALLGLRGSVSPFFGTMMMYAFGMRGSFTLSLGMILFGAGMLYFAFKDVFGENERSLIATKVFGNAADPG